MSSFTRYLFLLWSLSQNLLKEMLLLRVVPSLALLKNCHMLLNVGDMLVYLADPKSSLESLLETVSLYLGELGQISTLPSR